MNFGKKVLEGKEAEEFMGKKVRTKFTTTLSDDAKRDLKILSAKKKKAMNVVLEKLIDDEIKKQK